MANLDNSRAGVKLRRQIALGRLIKQSEVRELRPDEIKDIKLLEARIGGNAKYGKYVRREGKITEEKKEENKEYTFF